MEKIRYILGIDEAGRGCVLGPLVLAGVMFEDREDLFDILHAHNVRDSKLLTRNARRELAHTIRKLKSKTVTRCISPAHIDEESINSLEIKHSVYIINKLLPHTVYLDVPASGRGVQNYCSAVSAQCSPATTIIGGNKYDSIHLVVAAASIIAKERREKEVQKLHALYGNFGSGYPSDPRTQEWLRAWNRAGVKWPNIVRTKWQTVQAYNVLL